MQPFTYLPIVTKDDAGSCSATLRRSFIHMIWTWLTESCPDRYWGASLSMLGLIGDVTEMDGRSIFWDSKELEPIGTNITQQHGGIKQEEETLRTLTWFQLCMCAVWYPWNISGKKERVWDEKRKGVVGRDQFDLMLTVDCFNDCKSCINLHLPTTSSAAQISSHRNWLIEGYFCFYPLLSPSKTIGGEVHSAVQSWLHQRQRERGTGGHDFLHCLSFVSPCYVEQFHQVNGTDVINH